MDDVPTDGIALEKKSMQAVAVVHESGSGGR
jgi:hypothetical protein